MCGPPADVVDQLLIFRVRQGSVQVEPATTMGDIGIDGCRGITQRVCWQDVAVGAQRAISAFMPASWIGMVSEALVSIEVIGVVR